MADELNVQVRFTADTIYGKYEDALYIPKADFDSLTQEQIDAMKQERIDNWVYFVGNTPPPPVPPEKTTEELESELLVLNARIEVIKGILGE